MTSVHPPSRALHRAADVAHVELDGETVAYDPRSGAIHLLNPTATLVWDLFAEPGSVDEVVCALADVFPVPREILERDVDAVTADLLDQGLLAEATTAALGPDEG